MVAEQRQPVHLAVLTETDRQSVQPDRNLMRMGCDDVLQRVVDHEPGFDLMRSARH